MNLKNAANFLKHSLLAFILTACSSTNEKNIKYQIEPLYSVRDAQFRQSMGSLLGPSIVDGNHVITLMNGDRIFSAMLKAIRGAQKTITFETYVFSKSKVAHQFAEALSERARAGLKVHALFDAHGSEKMDKNDLALMKRSGVEVEIYHPFQLWDIKRYNNRTHRKLLIIDGKTGFTGGVGIADEWTGNADSPKHWRDSHYRVEGHSVAQLQATFMDNWLKTHEEVLHGPEYFQPLQSKGAYKTQVFKSSPREGSVNVNLMYLLSIASAQKNIRIESAYFVPDKMSVDALANAAKRRVKVEIIVPGPKIDQKIVRRASRARWGELLKAGVEIYEYLPTMIHCKIMIVDDLWVSVGSANFDNRSFRLNDEANMNVMDSRFAAEQVRIFEKDKIKTHQVTFEEWRRRSASQRLSEFTASLLFFQL